MHPSFPRSISIPVINFLTGDKYTLCRIDSINPEDEILEEIITICNQKNIYSWLFEPVFHGRSYERSDAQKLFEGGITGWRKNEKFVFLLMNADGLPAACIDIKSSNLEYAEIGYWSSTEHRGVMTNTVLELVDLAREAGFKRLFGRTRKENKGSSKVLERVGFVFNRMESKEDETHDCYELNLNGENKAMDVT